MKKLLIATAIILGLSGTVKADTYRDLNCLSATSVIRDFLIDHMGAKYNGNRWVDLAFAKATDIQDDIFNKYPIGHSIINTRNMDRVKRNLFLGKTQKETNQKAAQGVNQFCASYLN